ncbi:MAG: hypothetical protein N2Z81_01625 [Hydrogenothermaceae bacterium]|nr:hypothetical protein [Hydrogenothermaceae bacterium]
MDCCEINGKYIKDVSQVKKTDEGVLIELIDSEVSKEKLEEMITNCQTGRCECMTEETKKKITFIELRLIDGKPAIQIKGDVSKEEIESAMSKSKVEI